jgi:hypothetical protein
MSAPGPHAWRCPRCELLATHRREVWNGYQAPGPGQFTLTSIEQLPVAPPVFTVAVAV